MNGLRWNCAALIVACLITLVCGAREAPASRRCDITLLNRLDEPVVVVKILYDTPDGDPRVSSSEVSLLPGGEFRSGVQGVTLPKRIIVYLPLASYDFPDLSGLAPESAMRLEIAYEDGIPRLKREGDAAKSAGGSESKFLTPQNRLYAVDRDFLTDAATMEAVRDLVAETVTDEEPPAANLADVLFTETFNGRTTLYFPVFWTSDHYGYAAVTALDPDNPNEGISITVNIPLPEDGAPDVADNLLDDLGVDGYRPLKFNLSAWDDARDKQINFMEGNGDKYDDRDMVQEDLAAVLASGELREAAILWTQEEAFDKAKAAGTSPEGPAVFVRIANEQLQAHFLPSLSLP